MKISVSLYSNEYTSRSLEDVVRELDDYSVDLFHLDCMDDLAVFEDIKRIRSVSSKPIDLHIISAEPSKFTESIADHAVEYVTFQHENLPEGVGLPSNAGTRFGIAITSQTQNSAFDVYAAQADFIVFMATAPGKSGGRFDKAIFKKIRAFRKKHPDKKVHVDGGVNAEVSFILRNMGVVTSVSGSYVFKASCLGAALMDLRNKDTESHYKIQDFMIEKDEAPILPPGLRTFRDVLVSIDEHRLGFTILVDDAGRLEGLIANADVRKGLIRSIENIGALNVGDIVNRSPVFIDEEATVSELLRLVKSATVPVTYLPVTNSRREVTGALTFFNLIDGEL